ncbi:hypothetical protein AB0M39_35130 [Streptomyces sp. NPDC051907]|uniref:hypothetical protein n=1 Tax=Streptomyces sp. NPDC051907 TaxID=3155284 RepID=UPI00342E3889
MTRSDFQAIAGAVAETKRWAEGEQALAALEEAARQLARACAGQYQGTLGFNRPRFMEACGFPEAR